MLQNQTESTPCTKLWQNKFFFRTFMVGWAFCSFFVCLITGNDFWSIKHFPPLYKVNQRQTLSGLELFFFTVLDQIFAMTALWCPRQRWVFLKRTVSFRYDWPYLFTWTFKNESINAGILGRKDRPLFLSFRLKVEAVYLLTESVRVLVEQIDALPIARC